MILNELYDRSPDEYQNLSQDNSQPEMGQLRKTRLTLRQIKRLREMNDLRDKEFREKLRFVRLQYAPPAEPAV